jgi:two-component system, OmpR family, response regulator RegX3
MTISMTVLLVVEDDQRIAEPLIEGLERVGFETRHVTTGAAALEMTEVDLVLLDLGLPDMDGLDVLRALRSKGNIPIVVISARTDDVDRIVGLEIGADDYVTKPFVMRELVARIRTVLRRTVAAAEIISAKVEELPQVIAGLVIDRRKRKVTANGDLVILAPKEFDLLVYLADDLDFVRTRSSILEHVWDEHWWGSTKTLDVHIAALRRKLGTSCSIETIRGVGYRLTADEVIATDDEDITTELILDDTSVIGMHGSLGSPGAGLSHGASGTAQS